eukprot:GSChrysophyteH1.ASY1.ANO1.123.1 assembled CDS
MITKGASFTVRGGSAGTSGSLGEWAHLTSHYYLASFILTSHVLMNVAGYTYGKYEEYVKGREFDSTLSQIGKVFIVTGANTGIGYHTTKELVKLGATVVMACRTVSKANDARQSILQSSECKDIAPSKILVLHLDLNSFASVRKFVDEFLKLNIPLHGLINNAGLMNAERYETPNGHEVVMTANHLSHFLLSNLLEEEVCYGRIVTLSSALHKIPASFNFDDIMSEQDYSLFGTYAQSKLANVLFTIEMQRRLALGNHKIVANCVHPGCVRTEVTRGMSPLVRFGNDMAAPFMKWLQKTPREGCFSSVHAAIAADAVQFDHQAGMRGGAYYFHCEQQNMGRGVNYEDAKRLWQVSEAYVEQKFLKE